MKRCVDTTLRRVLDVVVSGAVLALLAPLLLLIAIIVRATSKGPALFIQRRIGRDGVPFGLLKFRTMVADAPSRGPALTVGADPRITRAGAMLRRSKLDELPQLLNVLRGDMSLVGPRPEVPEYVAAYTEAQRAVLRERPGITDPASLELYDEAELLGAYPDPERVYREKILPAKLAMSIDYLARRTVSSDLWVLARTIVRVGSPSRSQRAPRDRVAAGAAAATRTEESGTPGELRRDVVSGAKWSALTFYFDAGLRLAISVGLARILVPEEFGLMALAMAVVGVFRLVQDSGLAAALVQHRGSLDAAATTALGMTTVAGGVLAAANWLAAPWLASYLDHPELTSVMRVLALLFVVHGLTHAPRALLQRSMRFRPLAVVQLSSTVTYGLTAVVLALQAAGVWSLVLAQIASEVASCVAAWVCCPWRPTWRLLDRRVARELSRFGRHILGANLMDVVRAQIPVVVIGKLLGADVLGLYWMSFRWASLPTEGITHVVARVSYPAFSRISDQRKRFADGYSRALELILLLALPAAVGLSLVAGPLVEALYDARWVGAVTPLRIMAFYGLFLAVAASTGEVFKAAGVPRYVFAYSVLYTLLLVGLLLVFGASAGLEGIAGAIVGAPLIVAIATVASVCRVLGLRLRSVAMLAAVPLQATAGMAAAVLGLSACLGAVGAGAWLKLLSEAAAGALVYAAVVHWLEPGWLRELASLVGLRGGGPAVEPGVPVRGLEARAAGGSQVPARTE